MLLPSHLVPLAVRSTQMCVCTRLNVNMLAVELDIILV